MCGKGDCKKHLSESEWEVLLSFKFKTNYKWFLVYKNVCKSSRLATFAIML